METLLAAIAFVLYALGTLVWIFAIVIGVLLVGTAILAILAFMES